MVSEYNPWESGLKERQAKERKEKAEKAEKEEAQQEAEARAKAEALALAEAARPKPEVSAEEFTKILDQAKDLDAKVELLKARGSDLFRTGFPDIAIGVYSSLIALQPTHQAFSNRSACRCALRQYQGALDDAEACIARAPNWTKGYARLGAALYGMYRWDDAICAYDKGLKLEPTNPALQQGLEDAHRRRAQAGGQWMVCVDGDKLVEMHTREGIRMLQQLFNPQGLCCCLDRSGSTNLCVLDGDQIKMFSPIGCLHRTFNEKYKDSGATSLEDVYGYACDGESMFTAEICKNRARIQRLMVVDSRSVGCKKEAPDKALASTRCVLLLNSSMTYESRRCADSPV